MSVRYIVGYDPGGTNAHGLAILKLAEYRPVPEHRTLSLHSCSTVREAVRLVGSNTSDGKITAVGIDTLTKWGLAIAGWRPADIYLRDKYGAVAKSVMPPTYLSGAMSINGAAFLLALRDRFSKDGAMLTEAHPKVLYFALTGKKHEWKKSNGEMVKWITNELKAEVEGNPFGKSDHTFDAALALLAAEKGFQGEWKLDLHSIGDGDEGDCVEYIGPTHFWWPEGNLPNHS